MWMGQLVDLDECPEPPLWSGWIPGWSTHQRATSLIWMNSIIWMQRVVVFLALIFDCVLTFVKDVRWLPEVTYWCYSPPRTSFFGLHATVSQRSPTPHPKLQIAAPFHSSNSQYHSVRVFIVNQYSVTSAHINGGDCPKIKKNSGPCVLFGDKGTKCPLKCRQTSMTDTFNQTNTIKALLFPWCVYSICFVCIS